MRFLSVNENSFMVELENLDAILALFAELQNKIKNQQLKYIKEMVPTERTLLIIFDNFLINLQDLQKIIAKIKPEPQKQIQQDCIEIPVIYDGEDLDDVAQILSLSREELIKRHTASTYIAGFIGFSPGFSYLIGDDPIFNIPRRKSPRVAVPASSLALGGKFCGVYPRQSPGGWQLIGHSQVAMFDIERKPAALIKPSDIVKFIDVTGKQKPITINTEKAKKTAKSNKIISDKAPLDKAKQDISVRLTATMMPIYFQDKGRRYQASQGLSPSGALDQGAIVNANHLVGNDDGAVVLEITLGNVEFLAIKPCVVAFAGADCPISILSTKGENIIANKNQALAIDEGDIIKIASAEAGFRLYMAIRGGFKAPMILGSASYDSLSQIGPEPIMAPYDLANNENIEFKPVATIAYDHFTLPKMGDIVTLDVVLGPRDDWFTAGSIKLFLQQTWKVTSQSSRVGCRLEGEQPLSRAILDELPSEATVMGAIQVPANGQPIVFLADKPLTGGYPVIANIAAHHIDLAGQIPIGCRIRFNKIKI